MTTAVAVATAFTAFDAIKLVSKSELAAFTMNDYYAYAGVESKFPMIAHGKYVYGIDYTVIVDGDKVEITFFDGSDTDFTDLATIQFNLKRL